jgi:hypothetical protein
MACYLVARPSHNQFLCRDSIVVEAAAVISYQLSDSACVSHHHARDFIDGGVDDQLVGLRSLEVVHSRCFSVLDDNRYGDMTRDSCCCCLLLLLLLSLTC